MDEAPLFPYFISPLPSLSSFVDGSSLYHSSVQHCSFCTWINIAFQSGTKVIGRPSSFIAYSFYIYMHCLLSSPLIHVIVCYHHRHPRSSRVVHEHQLSQSLCGTSPANSLSRLPSIKAQISFQRSPWNPISKQHPTT